MHFFLGVLVGVFLGVVTVVTLAIIKAGESFERKD
jgi:hypothetical protein